MAVESVGSFWSSGSSHCAQVSTKCSELISFTLACLHTPGLKLLGSDLCPYCFLGWKSSVSLSRAFLLLWPHFKYGALCSHPSAKPSLFRAALVPWAQRSLSPGRCSPGSAGAVPQCLGQRLLWNFHSCIQSGQTRENSSCLRSFVSSCWAAGMRAVVRPPVFSGAL